MVRIVAVEGVTQDGGAARRKRLGQYFTGAALAEVLAKLARAETASTVIDPMAGSGDMLAAVHQVGGGASRLHAVEIDPTAAEAWQVRFESVASFSYTLNSAFSPAVWSDLDTVWDLVITNPPYVRYQLTSSDSFHGITIPSAAQVRSDLMKTLDLVEHLSPEERATFQALVKNYSGLADMAVPSWILCAALVKPGGHLAMVVPDTWLTREYALPVLYLLARYFALEFVVRDADAAWFDDALVRTTLVVAQRVPDRGTGFTAPGHLDVSLTRAASQNGSLLGRAFRGAEPARKFAIWAEKLRSTKSGGAREGVTAAWNDGTDLLSTLRAGAAKLKDIETAPNVPPQVPRILRPFIGDDFRGFVTLEDCGWRVGQGLRSGANDFFYVEETPDGFQSPLLPSRTLDLPREVLRPAIRSQSDLRDDRVVVTTTHQRLLVLEGWIHPADYATASNVDEWSVMTGDLADLVAVAQEATYQRAGRSQRIPSLSAVRTNVVRDPEGKLLRQWYHLPKLQARHTPAAFIPRVNHGTPRPYVPGGSNWVVDANFSTLWPEKDALALEVLVAMLTSAWAGAQMEQLGTVLGGGALKLEAAQIRRLLLPQLTDRQLSELNEIGASLIASKSPGDTVHLVDLAVLRTLGQRKVRVEAADELRKLARIRQLQ